MQRALCYVRGRAGRKACCTVETYSFQREIWTLKLNQSVVWAIVSSLTYASLPLSDVAMWFFSSMGRYDDSSCILPRLVLASSDNRVESHPPQETWVRSHKQQGKNLAQATKETNIFKTVRLQHYRQAAKSAQHSWSQPLVFSPGLLIFSLAVVFFPNPTLTS